MEHPKLYDLRDRLRLRRPAVIGYLEMLWHFAAKFAPQGNVGKYPDARIEAALDWSGRPGKLVEALVDAGWLNRHPKWRLVVHDWHDHADDVVRKRLARAHQEFLSFDGKVTGQNPVSDRTVLARQDEFVCLPSPSLARPEPSPSPAASGTASYNERAACEVPVLPSPPSAEPQTQNGTHPIEEVRSKLHEYVTRLCRLYWPPPDDDICVKVLLAAGGDVEELQQKLIVLWKQKRAQPSRSYAWLISVVRGVK